MAFLLRGRLATTRATGMSRSCQIDCLQLHAGVNPKGYTCESGCSHGSLLVQVDLSKRLSPSFSYGKGDKEHGETHEVGSAWYHNQKHRGPYQPSCLSICCLPLNSLVSVLKARLYGCMMGATCLFERSFTLDQCGGMVTIPYRQINLWLPKQLGELNARI